MAFTRFITELVDDIDQCFFMNIARVNAITYLNDVAKLELTYERALSIEFDVFRLYKIIPSYSDLYDAYQQKLTTDEIMKLITTLVLMK